MPNDRRRLEPILELVGHIQRRLDGQPREALFADDRDELDLTSFRLMHIGENANRLPDELKDKHPDLPWAPIYQLRNVLAHDYERIDPMRISDVIGPKLLQLAAVCRAELARPAA